MTKNSRSMTGWTHWLAIALAVMVTVAGFAGATELQLNSFAFRFNPYALLSLLAIVGNVLLLIFISRIKSRTDEVVWFSLYVTSLLFWAVAEFFTRISAGADTFLFWWPMSTLAFYFMPALLFMFVLAYTRPREARHVWTMVSLFGAALFLIFFDFQGAALTMRPGDVVPTPWNGTMEIGPYFVIVSIWMIGLIALSVGLLARFYHQTHDVMKRRQAGLFMVAILLPVVTGAITRVGLPAMGIPYALPMAAMLTAVSAGIITYGILRYRFLSLSPVTLSQDALGAIKEGVILVKSDLSMGYVNNGAAEMLGYTTAEIAQKRFPDFLTQEWTEDMLRKTVFNPMLVKTGAGKAGTEFESMDLRTHKGNVIVVKLSVSPVWEEDELTGYLVVMTDITSIVRSKEVTERTVKERTRELAETQATLAASINSLSLGFIITNRQVEVIRLNTMLHDVFCPHAKSHTASDCRQVTMAMVQEAFGGAYDLRGDIEDCMHKQLPHEVKNVVFHDRNWRLYFSPMVVKRVSIGCALVVQDVTEEMLLQRSRDEFFSIASHELRTPLTSIKGNSSLILQFYTKLLKDQTLKEMVTDIHDSSDRLIGIVNDFLDVSRLEQGRIQFHLERLSVAKVIEEVVYGMSALVKQKGLQLKVSNNIRKLDALPDAVTDRNRIKQVLFNLLGNAVKFTPKGYVKIEAEIQDDFIKVVISDTGPGIDPESQKILFRKFQQVGADARTRDRSNGSGLGLYISRMLASGMGGDMGLDHSELGKGSAFYLTVPIATPERVKNLDQPALSADLTSALRPDVKK